MYYVFVSTKYKEYWCITKDPKEGMKKIVELYNKNVFNDDEKLTFEQFIKEYPDGSVCKISMDTAYDDDYNSPMEICDEGGEWDSYL